MIVGLIGGRGELTLYVMGTTQCLRPCLPKGHVVLAVRRRLFSLYCYAQTGVQAHSSLQKSLAQEDQILAEAGSDPSSRCGRESRESRSSPAVRGSAGGGLRRAHCIHPAELIWPVHLKHLFFAIRGTGLFSCPDELGSDEKGLSFPKASRS